jgi:fumarate reductase subunit C
VSARNTYIRPMSGWYRRNPRFVAYLLREGTSVFLALYALLLLWGLTALSGGAARYERWLAFLASPLSVVLHLLILVAAVYHTITWFEVAPKATPPLSFGGKPVAERIIIGGGYAASAVITLVILAVAW